MAKTWSVIRLVAVSMQTVLRVALEPSIVIGLLLFFRIQAVNAPAVQ